MSCDHQVTEQLLALEPVFHHEELGAGREVFENMTAPGFWSTGTPDRMRTSGSSTISRPDSSATASGLPPTNSTRKDGAAAAQPSGGAPLPAGSWNITRAPSCEGGLALATSRRDRWFLTGLEAERH